MTDVNTMIPDFLRPKEPRGQRTRADFRNLYEVVRHTGGHATLPRALSALKLIFWAGICRVALSRGRNIVVVADQVDKASVLMWLLPGACAIVEADNRDLRPSIDVQATLVERICKIERIEDYETESVTEVVRKLILADGQFVVSTANGNAIRAMITVSRQDTFTRGTFWLHLS